MRTSVRVISPNFELLGEIDDYESLIFVRKHYLVGEFELYINIEKEHTEKLVKDNLIWVGNDNKKVGVIRHREIKLTEEGTEQLFVKGYTLKGVLGRRIIVPPNNSAYDNATGSQECIMKQFVDNNVVNPTDNNRKIPQVYINPNQNRGKQDKWRGRFETVSDKLTEVGLYSELGWDVWLDIGNRRWVFDVVEGRNLTASQDILPPVLFSVDFDNIKGQSFIDSSLKHSNVGYAGGKGEEEDRLIQQIGKEQGLSRIESFIDCSNSDNIEELNEEGQRKLKELKRILTFESEVVDFNSFIYGKDWDLGDITTIQNKKWNVTMNAQIVEVREIYDIDGFNIEPVFGDDIPTFIDEIKEIKTKQNLSESGVKGSPGKDGSDANVTNANVINAIGYTPANKVEFDNLEIGGRNLFIRSNIDTNICLLGAKVGYISDPRFAISDFIPVSELVTYIKSGNTGSSRVGFFDNDKEFIDVVSVSDDVPFMTPKQCRYIRINIHITNIDNNIKVEKGEVATKWTPALEEIQVEIDGVKGDIPTKLSQLTNDEGYLKSLPSHEHIAKEVKFTDGETFQKKLDSGKLTGPQGLPGSTNVDGIITKINDGDVEYPISVHSIYDYESGINLDEIINGLDHDKADKTDVPVKLSELENDLVIESGGTKIITSTTEPNLSIGDQWHKEY